MPDNPDRYVDYRTTPDFQAQFKHVVKRFVLAYLSEMPERLNWQIVHSCYVEPDYFKGEAKLVERKDPAVNEMYASAAEYLKAHDPDLTDQDIINEISSVDVSDELDDVVYEVYEELRAAVESMEIGELTGFIHAE
jgi:hypothetical protein